jgi:outer membrane receptor protein involved in Fe transport
MMSSLKCGHRRIVSTMAAAGLATLLGASSAIAQARSGDVSGTITDLRTHSPIAGARVSIVTPERVAITDQRGTYILRDVPEGRYSVTITAIGRQSESKSVSISGSSGATLDAELKDGSLMLSSVVVSATRTRDDAAKVASTVNVLTAEQVRQSPARESQDLLREIPAVELPRTSSLVGGTAQIVSIRGVDEGRTAVLADGIPINDAWGEWIDWGRMPKAMLDHVEVVEGGTSSLYGNGAMGGLISYFTRPLAPGAVTMQVDGGSRNARHAFVGAGVPLFGALTANVSGDYLQGGGYNMIDKPIPGSIDGVSQIIQRNGFARLNYAPSSKLSAFAGGHWFGDSRSLGTPLTYANRDQRDLSLGLDYGQASTGTVAIRAWDGRQIESQRAAAFRDQSTRAAEDSSLTATIPSHDWGASAVWTKAFTGILESFSVGGDYRHYQGDYNEVDFSTAGCATNAATCHTLSRIVSSGGSQALSGVFMQAILAPWTPLRVELSARGDRWENSDGHSIDRTLPATSYNTKSYGDSSKNAFSPRAGIRYQLTSSLSLRAAYYRAFRAPNLAELYKKQFSGTNQITLPNPYLSSENAEGREAGFDWQPINWFQLRGTWYVADYNNFNVPTTLPGVGAAGRPADCGTVGTCRMRLNVNKSRSEGGEAYIALHPITPLYLSAGVNYDNDRQQSNLPATATDETKPHINRVPSPKQTIRATYTTPKTGDWTVIWRHEGPTTTLQGVWLQPFTVVDANIQREIAPGLRGFIWVDNIGDKVYQVNLSGQNTAASPLIVTKGMPRTIRAGVEAYRF